MQNARLFLIQGDECIRISWGDYGYSDLSRVEIMPAVQDVLGEEYVYESTPRWGTVVVNLHDEDEVLIVSEYHFMWKILRGGKIKNDFKTSTEVVRSHAQGIWKKSEGYKPL